MNLDKIKADITPLVESVGLVLYKLEYLSENDQYILRVTVDKKGYVDMDEVTKVTELVNEYLDKEDPIDNEYQLEVTSRGIEKEFTIDELPEYKGEYIFIKTVDIEMYGTLLTVETDEIVLKDRKNKKIKINLNDVVYLRTAIKF